jgi:hypothetical protein
VSAEDRETEFWGGMWDRESNKARFFSKCLETAFSPAYPDDGFFGRLQRQHLHFILINKPSLFLLC